MSERYDNPDDNGDESRFQRRMWVLYSDYAKLEATIERVRNEVSATNTLTGREVQQCVLRVLDQK